MQRQDGHLRLRGQAWWLRKSVGGKVKDVALGVYGGEANRKEAEKAAKKVAKQLKETHTGLKVLKSMGVTPAAPKSGGMTFREWWARYQEVYSPEKGEETQQRDIETLAHWLPLIGDKLLTTLTQSDCQHAVMLRRHAFTGHKNRKTRTRLTEDTVQRERRLIRAILQRAVEEGKVEKNPMQDAGKPKKGYKPATRAERVLTPEDEVKLLEAMRTPVKDAVGRMVRMDERYPRFVGFMLLTGLRIDELLNEHFRDKGAYVRVKGKFAKERDVALTKEARRLLDEQWADEGDKISPRPKPSPCDCCGAGRTQPWWQIEQRFRGVMTKACKRAGIRHLSPHDLRHTFGHRYLELYNGRIEDLSNILGHATIAVTERHYAYRTTKNVQAKMLAAMESVA